MGKQRISAMFTANVFRKKSDDNKIARGLNCDSLVDDVIAEFAPDHADRERRKRSVAHSHLNNLGLGLGFHSCPTSTDNYTNTNTNTNVNKNKMLSCSMMDVSPQSADADAKETLNLTADGGDFVTCGSVEDVEDVKDEKSRDVVQVKSEMDDMREKEVKVFALNAKIKEEKIEAFNVTTELQAMQSDHSVLNEENASGSLNSLDKSEFVLEVDGLLPFYILDAYEEIYGSNVGTLYLFGKVKSGSTYHSCCGC